MFIESLARRVFLGPPYGSGGLNEAVPLPDWGGRPYRVLFLRDDRVGDMVMSLEIMRAIAESSPTITLDVLASPSNARLVERLPWSGEVLVHERGALRRSPRLRRQLARRAYDAVIDGRVFVNSVSLQRAMLLQSTGARWRIGLAGRRHGEIYNVPVVVPDLPHWMDYLVALAAPFGVAPNSRDWRPRLHASDAARAVAARHWSEGGSGLPRVVVNISAGHRNRRWPDDRWRVVLQRLRARLPRASVLVLAMPSDHQSAQRLADSVGGRAPMLGLDAAIALVATADIVITPDTAMSHISSAFQRPTLTILPSGYERLVPYRTPGRNVFGDDPRSLRRLALPPVIAALDSLIDEFCPGSA